MLKASVPARNLTRPVNVGGVQIGGGAPVVVQSMTCTPTTDADATLAQINALVQAGCDIVRVSVPTAEAVEPFGRICSLSPFHCGRYSFRLSARHRCGRTWSLKAAHQLETLGLGIVSTPSSTLPARLALRFASA